MLLHLRQAKEISFFYAHPNKKETTTVHQITLPPSTGERSEGAQDVPSKRKEFKDVQKEKRKVRNAHPSPFKQQVTTP